MTAPGESWITHRVGFGAWAIGGWYWGGGAALNDETAVQAILAARAEGANFIDTAPVYGFGHSERVVGQALRAGGRDGFFVATKCGLRWDLDQGTFFFDTTTDGRERRVFRNLRRNSILVECDESLRRLGTDHIDLYQTHWPDPTVPLDEACEAMDRLFEAGKIRAVGLCNCNVEMVLDWRRLLPNPPLLSVQEKYNLLERKIEKGLLPFARKNGPPVIAYSPLAQGLLTGRVSADRVFDEQDGRAKRSMMSVEYRGRVNECLATLAPLTEQYACTLANLAVAWVLAESAVGLALCGARTPAQARENLRAARISLEPGDADRIGDAFAKITPPP